MNEILAAHAARLIGSDVPPEWIQLLPAGTSMGRDGRGPYVLSAAGAEAVIAATKAYFGSADIPIDYDHQLYYAKQNGQPAPASGWIVELAARDGGPGEGGLWGRVEWTARAAAAIVAREFRYISPLFWHTPDGTVTRLEAASLVCNPNLELPALAAREPGEQAQGELMDLKAFIAALCTAFGLSPDTTAEALAAHAKNLATQLKTATDGLAGAAVALGLPATAGGEQLAAHAKDILARPPDPAQYVPIGQYNDLLSAHGKLRDDVAKDKAATVVAEAKAAGKVSPAMEKWALGYAASDPAGFDGWAKAMPAIVAPGGEAPAGSPPKDGGKLDADQLALCSKLGINPEDFQKNAKEGA